MEDIGIVKTHSLDRGQLLLIGPTCMSRLSGMGSSACQVQFMNLSVAGVAITLLLITTIRLLPLSWIASTDS